MTRTGLSASGRVMTQNASCIFHNGDDGDDDYNESGDVDHRGGGGGGDDDDDVESEGSQDAQRVGWAVSAPTTTASTSWSQSQRNMNNGQEIGG